MLVADVLMALHVAPGFALFKLGATCGLASLAYSLKFRKTMVTRVKQVSSGGCLG